MTKMQFTSSYFSPLGELLLAADEVGLVGLWFAGQRYFASALTAEYEKKDTPLLMEAREWLTLYFSGKAPHFTPPLHLIGSEFRRSVWELLLTVPYGDTVTYGELAQRLSSERGANVSAQAVGGAVGHNPVSIIVPCHRVIGADGSLTGYAAGTERKAALLRLEKAGKSISNQKTPYSFRV